MRRVVIFGTGDIGQLAHFYFTHDSPYEVAAFTADRDFVNERELFGLPVVAFEDVEREFPPGEFDMFVALSYRNMNALRAERYAAAKKKGYALVSYVCTRGVHWGDTEIGDNCFILENQTIQPFVRIGSNVTIWSGNHIGHHSVIGDHCFIASHVVISGHVTIEPYCFLGVNSTIRDGITISRQCVIGAGTLILKDTIEKGVYRGNATDVYLDDSSKLKRI